MSEPLVITEIDEAGCALLTLNRPAKMNALSLALRAALAGAIESLTNDSRVRVMILTGAGKAFCAGLDLAELSARGDALGSTGAPVPDPVAALARFDGPVIGAINGLAVTGGFELALACDILIASSAARFADTHVRVGVMPGWGLSQRLSRAIGIYRAKELSLTGNFLSAEQAERWGLVNRVVAPEALLPEARQLARDMLDTDPMMLRAYRRLIDDGFAVGLGEAMTIERRRAREANVRVDPAEVERRRAAIQARGRRLGG